jgi:hypothetical protein
MELINGKKAEEGGTSRGDADQWGALPVGFFQ